MSQNGQFSSMTDNPNAFLVGDWRVEADRNLLISPDGKMIRLPPKTMDVLCALVRRQGQVVAREDILNDVWRLGGAGDDSLNNAISSLRTAFGDNRKKPLYIETIPKRGYRLAAQVQSVATK